jgi:hypothetical protein
MKVTWTTSGRIHRTTNGKTTICGYDFSGENMNSIHAVHGKLHKKKKRHCRTCFLTHSNFKEEWLLPDLAL